MERMRATANQDKNPLEATMSVVVIYDKSDLAAKAKTTVVHAAYGTDEPMHCSVKVWRLDILELPLAAEAALAEALEAHLIVLAVRQVQSLLPWLGRWATRRQVREAGLAVWDSGNASTTAARGTPELSQFAVRHGLSLIFDDNGLVERQVSSTPTLQHVLEQSAPDCWRHGGINE
jgi:hypothetical protein